MTREIWSCFPGSRAIEVARAREINLHDFLNGGWPLTHDEDMIANCTASSMSWVTNRIVFFSLCQMRARLARIFRRGIKSERTERVRPCR